MAAVQAAAGLVGGAEVARLLTMPQAGLTTAATIVGETAEPSRFGGDVNRYVASCGLAPTVHQSGASGPSGRPRRRYNRHLKRAFLYLALNQVRADPRARAYYQRKRGEGKGHWPARRCLARHLCRIAFRMLSRGLTYAEAAGAPATTTGDPVSLAAAQTGQPAPAEAAGPRPDVCDVPCLVELVPDQTCPTPAHTRSGVAPAPARSESTACVRGSPSCNPSPP